MLKGLKSVDLKIIQMYHFRLKWKRYMVCANWWDFNFFWSRTPTFSRRTPTFCQMGVLNSCFQNPSESSGSGVKNKDLNLPVSFLSSALALRILFLWSKLSTVILIGLGF